MKENTLQGGTRLSYTPPRVDEISICVEQGFAGSNPKFDNGEWNGSEGEDHGTWE